MRVAIAGAGAVGRSIARELVENGHEVLLIDQKPSAIKVDSVPRAEWLLADACEISSLDDAALDRCNVVVAATGDDKVNLVVALLAKTEYGVPRVVARVNHPGNEWLYNESWGVDVAVSTPRLLSALVEEAVSVGDLVRLMTFGQSEASLVELTMPDDAPLAGQQVGSIEWPADSALVAILREGRVLVPQPEDPLQPGDELFFVTTEDVEEELERLFSAGVAGEKRRAGGNRWFRGRRRDRELAGDGGARARRGPHLEPAAERGEPVGHVPQARPHRRARAVVARPVVGHGEGQRAVRGGQADARGGRAGVLGGVLQRLEAAEVDGGLGVLREPADPRRPARSPAPATCRPAR